MRQDGAESTCFDFEHKVFNIPGTFFSLSRDRSQAMLNIPLGSTSGSVPLETLRTNFNIEPDSHDDHLLEIVERSLRYVRVIRPGETIPKELLDGSASWSVDDRHRDAARNRMTYQLVTWFDGHETVLNDRDQLEMIVGDPGFEAKAGKAIEELTQRLRLPREKKDEVQHRLNEFAHELAYIEALRERCVKIEEIAQKITKMQDIYRNERSIASDAAQALKLIQAPIQEFNAIFQQIDAQTGEILALLKTFDSQVAFTRQMRDEIHERLFDWDELIEKWGEATPTKGQYIETCLKQTYRYLCQRHLPSQVWKR